MNTVNRFDDSAFINAQTIPLYARTNEAFLSDDVKLAGHVKGIIIELPGLGGGSCLGGTMDRGDYDAPHAKQYAENGIILAYMFPGPWSWGNRGAIRMTDAVVAALISKYGLTEDIPLVVCGGSMGGLGALIYAADTRYRLCGVASACPCLDVPDRYDAHPDFPRTFISAVAGYDMPLADAMKTISPVYRVDDMPHVPYFICSDGADEVFPEEQFDGYIEALRARGHDVTYYRQPRLGHGGFLPEVWDALHAFMKQKILER